MILDDEDFEAKSSNSYWAGRLIDLPKDDAWEIATEIAETIEYALRQANGVSTKHEALHIADVGERSTGRITVSFFRKVYKQFIDEKISMIKMLELITEQAHRTDVCIKCQRPLDGTNVSKTKCNACFAVNA